MASLQVSDSTYGQLMQAADPRGSSARPQAHSLPDPIGLSLALELLNMPPCRP
jgi:hypothetical protein